MNKQRRLWMRIVILLILFLAVGFALYQNSFANKETTVQLNKQAPNFKLATLSDEKIELKDLQGKGVLVNFWASWCDPCKKEMPAIQKAYNQYKDKGFEVVAVNIQEPDLTVESFLKNNNITFPVILDKSGEVYNLWDVGRIPVSFFISSDGIIKRKYEGEMSQEQLDQWIKETL
ncbi:thiol-disulfide oxidoreductase ResA [Bacillus swezeyi]|uniref:thiol-disulfide oxidoreductase ResA n=1 Tax=Bacillus swezeyi TaxID=1925020 RepID=UPI0027DD72F8|nr:thiol-disulfide oxidoreductase ResA [Bacillus swezeyi]